MYLLRSLFQFLPISLLTVFLPYRPGLTAFFLYLLQCSDLHLPRPLDLGDSAARRTSSELARVTAAIFDPASHPTVMVQT